MTTKKNVISDATVESLTKDFTEHHESVNTAEKDLDTKKTEQFKSFLSACTSVEMTEDDYPKLMGLRTIWITSYMAVQQSETGKAITKKSGAKAYQRFFKDLQDERMKSDNKKWGQHDFVFPVRKATAESQIKAEQRKAKKDAHAKTDAGKQESLAKSQLAKCREMKVDIAEAIQKVINNASSNLDMVALLHLTLSKCHTEISSTFKDGMINNGELKATKRKPRAK
tara:strand:- start:40 stop:717 length:678 start_codon:yes stop_codon:yes gene_type:complete